MAEGICVERAGVTAMFQRLVLGLAVCLASPVFAQSALESYVARCKSQLGFETLPRFDCRGENFRPRTSQRHFQETNDWVNYRRVTNAVDAVFACRWVQNDEGKSRAATGEMIVHNRYTGDTCFFELKEDDEEEGPIKIPSTNPVSPTDPKASTAWEDLGRFNRVGAKICTECHAAGPYIASPQIVGALAKFGLINDGHDTLNERYAAVIPGTDYKDPVLQRRFRDPLDNATLNCASGCHMVANRPQDVAGCGPDHPLWETCESPTAVNNVLMPGINVVINDIAKKNVMPPTSQTSNYRWINRSTPYSTAMDRETLAGLRRVYPQLTCANPSYMQIRRVGSGVVLNSNDLPDKLKYFNLQDGLVCENDQYSGARCRDYSTRYKCGEEWTEWKNHSPNASGDYEQRSKFTGCENPSDIQAMYRNGDQYEVVYGPRDRLQAFTQEILECRNNQQDDGQCSNYSVRFICP